MTENEFKILDAAVKQGDFSLPQKNTRETLEILARLVTRGLLQMRPIGDGEWVWSVTPAGHVAHQKGVGDGEVSPV